MMMAAVPTLWKYTREVHMKKITKKMNKLMQTTLKHKTNI